VIVNKIKQDHTYLTATNYWSLLHENEEEESKEQEEEEINMTQTTPTTPDRKSNKWIRRTERRMENQIIIDSGATSHFMSEELKLPNLGKSNKSVYLPDNAKLTTSHKTQSPFEQLTDKAREADVLPGLKRSLMSVNKNVTGRIHNSLPPRRGRSNNPQTGNNHNHNQ
jgi:hypothetical protein